MVQRHAIAVTGLDARLDAGIVAQAVHEPAAQPDDGNDHHHRCNVLPHADAVFDVVGRMRACIGGDGTAERRRR